uniref:GTD-binding domain-containing protein n=1 Tax=Arundo donax TaxID=35708 RepID=A0A0A8YTW6_ARUDO
MGTRMSIFRRLSSALSTALLEWILMLLLFIDAVYSFLVTRFAHLCRLPAPCPFCSRLDHVLGNEKPCFYRELICKTHKSEISSLAFCHLHQKLAGAQSMCEGCCAKVNDDDKTDEPVMVGNIFDSNQGIDDVLNSALTRICSCCGQHFKQQRTLSSGKIAELEPTEAVGSTKIYKDYSVAGQGDESLEPKDIYHQSDYTSHERHSVPQMTSDSDVKVPCANNGNSSPPREANAVEEDLYEDEAFELPDIPSPLVVKQSERNVHKELIVTDPHATSLASPVADDHPGSGIEEDQMEQKDSLSREWASQHDPVLVTEDSSLKDADASQIIVASSGELPQVLGEIEPYHSRSESNIEPYTTQFTILEQHYTVSDNQEQVQGPEIPATSSGEFHQRSALANDPGTTELAPQDAHHAASGDADREVKDDIDHIRVSQVAADSEIIGEVKGYTKKIEPTGDMGIHELAVQDPSDNAPKDFIDKDYVDEAHISAVAVRSSGEVPQNHIAVEDYPKTCEPAVERRPSLSTQISMNEAYRLAIGNKSSLPSPTLMDVILGKDSTSSVNEELRLLLSQLSASRGLDAPWVDPGPSPRAYGRGDELVVQNITKRISLERNVSGLESLDGSIVSEMEGESTIDRLRRQIDLDRKSIHLLCRELEEERNASAIAASQALAMITKLQDEKAAMQMEASHYQRMMEEQAEYDNEALAKANELLAEREQQIEELEAELEIYRRQSGGGPIQTQANKVPFKEENIETALHGESCPFSLMSFEEERAYIAYCLRKLEQKLQSYSNNTSVHLSSSDAIQDDLSSKVSVVENDSLHRQESSEGTEEHISLGKEAGSSTMSGDFDLTTVQDEIASLNRRLKTLEGDHNFLEHSINSLRNGNEGLMFIREIACNLRELRAIAIGKK